MHARAQEVNALQKYEIFVNTQSPGVVSATLCWLALVYLVWKYLKTVSVCCTASQRFNAFATVNTVTPLRSRFLHLIFYYLRWSTSWHQRWRFR